MTTDILEGSSPSTVARKPKRLSKYLHCQRRESPEVLIHTTLQNRILGEFYDYLHSDVSPSTEDCKLALDLMQAMRSLSAEEQSLAFTNWAIKAGISFSDESSCKGIPSLASIAHVCR